MSEDGGSDLDVFENVSKAPLSARKKTLVGLAVPQGSAPALSSSGRASVPPPPPPSLRTSVPPPEPLVFADGASIDDADEIEEVDAVEELSSPLAAEAPDEATAPLGDVYESDDATQVFSGFGSSPEASEDPPTPMLTLGSAPMGPSLPPPPPPPSRSSIPQPPPPPFATAPSLPPPPPPPRPSGAPIPAPSTPSAGDWDEDDDKTSIFNRESGFDAAHMLMGTSQVGSVPIGSVPDAPPPPMSRPSAPIPSPPVMSMPAPRLAVPVLAPDSMPPAPTSRTPMVLVALALVLGAALFLLLRPTTGGLVVTVAGPGNRPLEGVEVLVDGKLLCSASPCTLADLPAGTHMVQARAKGYSQTAETAVIVTSGQDAVHNIRLAQAAGTGLRVAGTGAGLRLRVDGKEIGPLPQELGSLSPGVHEVEVVSDHFETWRRSITVTEEEMQNVEVPKLKVIKGLAVIKAGSGGDGARVVLESNGDRRVLPSLPMNLHIDTSKPHQLIASRAGYDTVRQDIVFEDGQAERVFEISFAKAPEPSTEPPRSGGGRRVAPTGPSPSPAPAPEPAAPKSGEGVLNINSIPASNILLDGRPVGRTPKLGLKVPAGKHTVVFILEGQRENKSVNVVAGQTATVTHRF